MKKYVFRFWLSIFIIIGLHINLNAFGIEDLKISKYSCSVGNEYTENICKNDMECNASLQLCKFTLDELQKIGLDDNIKKYIITYGAKGVVNINNFLIKKGLIKKIGKNSNLLNKVFKKYALALKSANKIGKSIVPSEWGIFALDIGVDIYTDLILESSIFSEQYKNNEFLKKIGDQDTAKQVIKWWISIAYSDIKWGIAYASGHPIIGAKEALVGNVSVLFDIFKEDAKLVNSLFDSKIEENYKNQMSKIWDLEFKYSKKYYHESNKAEKNKILTLFNNECIKIKLTGFLSFYASINGKLTVKNQNLRNMCNKIECKIQEIDRQKIRFLYSDIMMRDEILFEKHLKYFYPKYKYDYAWRMFKNPKEFDINTLSFYGDNYHDKVLKALEYGFKLDDFDLGYAKDPYDLIRKYTVLNWALKLQNKYKLGGNYEYNTTYEASNTLITRKIFVDDIYHLYNIKNWYYPSDYINKLEKLESVKNNGWTKESIGLYAINALRGDPKKDNFRPNDYLSIYEALTILVRVVDEYILCNTGEEY